jgi:hypothetical protein
MYCCDNLRDLADRGLVRVGPITSLGRGSILTEIDTEYFFAFGEERPSFAGMNYCPFCGRALSRELWNREKKK